MFPHHLEIGGSQTNCIDWATELRDSSNHEVVFCATPGPAGEIIAERGFRLLELPRPGRTPSWTVTRTVLDVTRQEHPDVVHAFEWPQILNAFYGAHLQARVPLLGTVLSMAVQTMLPRSIPLTYGSVEMAEEARIRHRAAVYLLEPPVDVRANAPGAADGPAFRNALDITPDTVAVVVVSRLISWLKAEGLFRAIESAGHLYPENHLRLIIVGGGPVQAELQRCASDCNDRHGAEVVTLTGPLLDPRAAYDGADIVLGMGGSAMRGMAFQKPCIVLGELGFSQMLTAQTAGAFVKAGFYGVGNGIPSDLTSQMRVLIGSPELRAELGSFSRELVVDRFGLQQSTARLVHMYEDTVRQAAQGRVQIGDGAATLARRAASALPDSVRHTLRQSPGKVRT